MAGGVTCDRLASHPWGNINILAGSMPMEPEINTSLLRTGTDFTVLLCIQDKPMSLVSGSFSRYLFLYFLWKTLLKFLSLQNLVIILLALLFFINFMVAHKILLVLKKGEKKWTMSWWATCSCWDHTEFEYFYLTFFTSPSDYPNP